MGSCEDHIYAQPFPCVWRAHITSERQHRWAAHARCSSRGVVQSSSRPLLSSLLRGFSGTTGSCSATGRGAPEVQGVSSPRVSGDQSQWVNASPSGVILECVPQFVGGPLWTEPVAHSSHPLIHACCICRLYFSLCPLPHVCFLRSPPNKWPSAHPSYPNACLRAYF